MSLIERYIAEVSKNLPRKNRKDIEDEIRSTLLDMLEERSQESGSDIDDDLMTEVLRTYGPPSTVAESYHPEPLLIRPYLYQSFLAVLKVVLPIMTVVAFIRASLIFSGNILSRDTMIQNLLQVLSDYMVSSLAALGGIVIFFVILQRALPDLRRINHWDPKDLPTITTRDRIDLPITILEILGVLLAIIFLTVFNNAVSIGYNAWGTWTLGFLAIASGKAQITTILTSSFFSFLPALTTLWILTIVLDVILLRRGRWENWSRWISLGLKIASITLAATMLASLPLVGIDPNGFTSAGFPDLSSASNLVSILDQVSVIILVLVIMNSLITAFRLLVRLTGHNLTPLWRKIAHP